MLGSYTVCKRELWGDVGWVYYKSLSMGKLPSAFSDTYSLSLTFYLIQHLLFVLTAWVIASADHRCLGEKKDIKGCISSLLNLNMNDTPGLYYKNLRTLNLLKTDKFCSKLVSFIVSCNYNSLDKHTSLLRNP